jgi:hypothetical protein
MPEYRPAPPWQQAPGWPGGPPLSAPQTYMIPAVLVTLFCFLPTGIAAIYFASQVTTKLQAGDFAGAADASNKAKTWVFVSLGVGVVLGFIIVAASSSTASTM